MVMLATTTPRTNTPKHKHERSTRTQTRQLLADSHTAVTVTFHLFISFGCTSLTVDVFVNPFGACFRGQYLCY